MSLFNKENPFKESLIQKKYLEKETTRVSIIFFFLSLFF